MDKSLEVIFLRSDNVYTLCAGDALGDITFNLAAASPCGRLGIGKRLLGMAAAVMAARDVAARAAEAGVAFDALQSVATVATGKNAAGQTRIARNDTETILSGSRGDAAALAGMRAGVAERPAVISSCQLGFKVQVTSEAAPTDALVPQDPMGVSAACAPHGTADIVVGARLAGSALDLEFGGPIGIVARDARTILSAAEPVAARLVALAGCMCISGNVAASLAARRIPFGNIRAQGSFATGEDASGRWGILGGDIHLAVAVAPGDVDAFAHAAKVANRGCQVLESLAEGIASSLTVTVR